MKYPVLALFLVATSSHANMMILPVATVTTNYTGTLVSITTTNEARLKPSAQRADPGKAITLTTRLVLETGDGTSIELPNPPDLKVEKYIGKQVTVTVRGKTALGKAAGGAVSVSSIERIEEVPAAKPKP